MVNLHCEEREDKQETQMDTTVSMERVVINEMGLQCRPKLVMPVVEYVSNHYTCHYNGGEKHRILSSCNFEPFPLDEISGF